MNDTINPLHTRIREKANSWDLSTKVTKGQQPTPFPLNLMTSTSWNMNRVLIMCTCVEHEINVTWERFTELPSPDSKSGSTAPHAKRNPHPKNGTQTPIIYTHPQRSTRSQETQSRPESPMGDHDRVCWRLRRVAFAGRWLCCLCPFVRF